MQVGEWMGRPFLGVCLAGLMLVALFLPLAPGAAAATLTKFSTGATTMGLEYPDGGGQNDTAAVVLPRDNDVASAYLDVEGRPVILGSKAGMIDFNSPQGSTAWTGAAASVPPDQKPVNYEDVDATADSGLYANWDGQYLSASGSNAAAYNMFEFDVSDLSLNNFTLYWKGNGWTEPLHGFSGNNIVLHMWNAATGQWENFYSFSHPSSLVDDREAWFNASAGANDYIDARGALTMMATVSSASYAESEMDTDYVSLSYAGKATFYPDNVTLDIGADGSVEWQRSGKLTGKASISGAAVADGFQRVLDGASTPEVQIPLRFTSKTGGILFLSNLSINHAPSNLPPARNGTIPVIEMMEGESGTGLLDLRQYFTDDGDVANLSFGVVYQQDASRIKAQLNPDGHRVDFTQPTQYWFGEESFRVRATDQKGLWVESQNFSVRVKFVNHAPKLEPVGAPVAYFGVPFEWTFRASDVDSAFDLNESLVFSLNSTMLALDAGTGRANFTPQKRDVGVHPLMVTVTDHYGAEASRNFTLDVQNVNSPPKITTNLTTVTLAEGENLTYQFAAYDPDVEIGLDSLIWSVNSSRFAFTDAGLLNITTGYKDAGIYVLRVTVSDSGGLSDSINLTVTVLNVPLPPVIAPVANLTVDEDADVTFRINATGDEPGDILNFTSDWALLKINATGWASFHADDQDIGVHVVNVSVKGPSGLTASVRFTITVRPVNDAPENAQIQLPANGTKFKQGALVSFLGNASDVDGDVLNYTWYSDGEAIGYGKSFSTKALKSGKHAITLTVSDGNLTAESGAVLIEIAKKPTAAAKGFLPGFEAIGVLAAGLLVALALGRRIC